jgi:hypothetical protein
VLAPAVVLALAVVLAVVVEEGSLSLRSLRFAPAWLQLTCRLALTPRKER